MKTLKIFIALLALTTGIANAQFTRAELQIAGLNCALCAKSTERSLRALPFVSDVKPDPIHNIYIIIFKNNQPVNFDQIGSLVHDAGFFVTTLKATFNFDNVKVADSYFSSGGNTFRLMNPADKPLNGEVAITIIDKGFAPRSVSKKYGGQVPDSAPAKSGHVYHVII